MGKIIIGKIPGYNSKIQKLGNDRIDYNERLKNNLTRVVLTPTGYKVNFGQLPQEIDPNSNEKRSVTTLYKIGPKEKTDAGVASTRGALESWKNMLNGSFNSKTELAVDTMEILCTNDSTMTESFGNEFGISTIESLSNKIGDSVIGQTMQTLKKGVTFDSQAGLELLSANDNLMGKNQFMNLIAGKALGIQTSLPKEWKTSSYTNSLQLMIKLISPSGDTASIQEYILKPLQFLILMTAPITYNGVTFGYPPIFDVKADGMMNIKLGVISNMTISRGGNETQFNRFNQPLNIDVRITIDPLVNGYASPVYNDENTKLSPNEIDSFLITNPNMLKDSFGFYGKENFTDENASYKTIKL